MMFFALLFISMFFVFIVHTLLVSFHIAAGRAKLDSIHLKKRRGQPLTFEEIQFKKKYAYHDHKTVDPFDVSEQSFFSLSVLAVFSIIWIPYLVVVFFG